MKIRIDNFIILLSPPLHKKFEKIRRLCFGKTKQNLKTLKTKFQQIVLPNQIVIAPKVPSRSFFADFYLTSAKGRLCLSKNKTLILQIHKLKYKIEEKRIKNEVRKRAEIYG